MKHSIFFLALVLAGSTAVSAETHFVSLGPNGYSNAEVSVTVGDHVIIQASPAHPLKFEMNPDISCTDAQCGFLFPINAGPFHFYCANHAAENGSISVLENDDLIHADGFDVLLVPVDV